MNTTTSLTLRSLQHQVNDLHHALTVIVVIFIGLFLLILLGIGSDHSHYDRRFSELERRSRS